MLVRLWRHVRDVVIASVVLWVTLAPAQAAEEHEKAIGFSRLIFRSDDEWAVAQSDDETRILILDYLRKKGLRAVGAEDLVFGKDSAGEAQLMLGGTIFDLSCNRETWQLANCVMGIRWEVLDVARDQVVYRAQVYGEFHDEELTEEQALAVLVQSAIDRLEQKTKFRELIRAPAEGEPGGDGDFEAATFKGCSVEPKSIEEDGNWALRAVAVVTSGDGVGSGFLISDDPFLMTAAHVVSVARPTLRFKNGHKTKASVIRLDKQADVALLRLDEIPDDATCLPVAASKSVTPGASVFVLGSPGGEDFAFSMSRGILSGVRIKSGVSQLQTDASINLGNSGGPLVNADAHALGVVSWKLAGQTVEGLGFAVAIHDALSELEISPGEKSDESLLQAVALVDSNESEEAFVEEPEARPILDPEEKKRQEARRKRYARAPFTAASALRFAPSVGIAHFPKGYAYREEFSSGDLLEGVSAVDFGLGLSTTFAFGLYLGWETRVSAFTPGVDCAYDSSGIYRQCTVPLWQNMLALGYDIRVGGQLVIRPKTGIGMMFSGDSEAGWAGWMGGLSTPIRLGKKSALALAPYVEVAVSIAGPDWVGTTPMSIRGGLAFDIGMGNLLETD